MHRTLVRITSLGAAVLLGCPWVARGQQRSVWLDAAKPSAWNVSRAPIPAAPKVDGAVDPRCRAQGRPAQLDEDRRVQARGWDLVGAYQGGWQMLVVQATAGYDGMCRPRRYQAFVFVGERFVGTLSPVLMDARTDGAWHTATIETPVHLSAQFLRYAREDALCCPSRVSEVTYRIDLPMSARESPVLVPVVVETRPLPR